MVVACPFPSLRGSQVLVRELAEALAAAGNQVHVVTYPTAQHLVPVERISIHRVPKLPALWTARPFGWQKLVLDLMLFFVLLRVVRQKNIDVIHAHNLEAPLVAYLVRALTGVPVVYHAHNALSDELPFYFRARSTRALARRVARFLDSRVGRWADQSIALSDRLAAFLAVRGAAGRVTVAPPAVAALPREGAAATVTGLPTIVYSGNLDRYQNLDCLIAGFERICAAEPRARLILLLHRAADPRVARRAADLARLPGVSVRTVATFAAAARALRGADVLVCPRTSWSGFPIKVLNYMAAGRPIVQARGSAHAIEDGVSGLLFDDDDPGALAKAVLRVIRDPELAERLGEGAREALRQRYLWARVLPTVLEVYAKVSAGRIESGKSETKKADGAGMRSMPDRVEQQRAPSTHARVLSPRRTTALRTAAVLLTALVASCTTKPPDTVAPLPPIGAPMVPGAAEQSPNYKIGVGDQLRVKFAYHPELDTKIPVGPDGNIQITGVGELPAAGKTAEALAADIEQLSSETLRDPEVTVIVAELGERVVYVMGEVRLPGKVAYREGMTPLEAIADRGGFTEVAQLSSVLHLSRDGNTYVADRLDFTRDIDVHGPEMAQLAVYDMVVVPRTYIGDANAVMRLYVRGLLPTLPRIGIGFSP